MARYGENNRAILTLIFCASIASLSFEIALLRLFSISLWYHFAFMVISIAMLGIAASGTVLAVFPALKDIRRISFYGLMLSASIPVSYLLANEVPFDPARLSWDRLQFLAISLYYLILCIPFFCFGLIVSIAYAEMSEKAHAIYASDLLGAGTGALAMVLLLSLAGPETSVFIVSMLPALALLAGVHWKARTASLLLIAVNLAILFMHPQFIQPRISPYKPFSLALQFPGTARLGTTYSSYSRVDLFTSPAIRFAPGLSFTYLDPLPKQTGLAIDAGDLHAITDEADTGRLAFLGALPSSLAYHLAGKQDVLIIEPRAGLAVLTAKKFKAKNIYAADSNPLVIRAVRDYCRAHGSHLYEENTWTGLGRTWIAASDRQFDVIDLSLMGPSPSAPFGFAEDYRFTVEAFEHYLAHLKNDGYLSLNLYIMPPPRTELRLLATLARAAEASGRRDISRQVAAIRSWDTLTLIVKKSVLATEDIGRIKVFAREKRFDLVYYPGIKPEESNVHIKMPGNEYAEAFLRLMNKETRDRFIDDYLFDIRPVTDEKPFFNYFLKVENIRAIYRLMGEKWQYFIEEGYLLPVLFVQVLVISAILVLLPLITLKRTETVRAGPSPLRTLSYFALLGVGYMFVELACIQKMILGLENPSYAATTVIASILISSGTGSLLGLRVTRLKNPLVLIILAGVIIVYSLLLPGTVAAISRHPLPVKIILSFVLLMPAGILMGIPFPLGISLLHAAAPRLIPWSWAVNGCFSVLAPILAVMLALSAGYHMVLFSGAAMYLIAFWILRRGLKTAG
jgi:hypothetical protein